MVIETPRVQPHDHEAEQAVLGAILTDASALARAQEILTPPEFYSTQHQRIFQAMGDLSQRGEPVDLLTVGSTLETRQELSKIGGRGALAELLTVTASASNVVHHCRIVRDHATRRRLIALAHEIHARAYGKDSLDPLLRDVERALFHAGREERTWRSFADITHETADYLDRLHKQTGTHIGVPSGFPSIDSLLGGWQRSDLVIIAARTSMGKTSFVLGSALAAAQAGFHVGVLSIEMSALQVGLRIHGMGASLDVHALRTGSLTHEGWRQFAHTAQQLEPLHLWVDDSSVLTVEQVAAKSRRLKATKGLDLLIVDYLQLLSLSNAETRQQGIADATRRLKLLAKELDVPVLALSQLSRDCEKRDDKRPMLADLRDSGAIEQDADVVLFLYRHEVYDRDTEEKGLAEVLVRKHRNGPVGDRRLKFVDRYARFEDLSEESVA